MTAPYVHFPALLSDGDAEAMIRLCERFGSYGMYGQKPVEEELGRGLYQRHDAAMNYIRTGGRFARMESIGVARRAHELLPRDLRLRRARGGRHRGFPLARRLRGGRAHRFRPADRSAGDRVREPPGSRPGARRAHRRPRVPRRQPHQGSGVAARRDAPLRALRALAHADRHRRLVVRRLPRR